MTKTTIMAMEIDSYNSSNDCAAISLLQIVLDVCICLYFDVFGCLFLWYCITKHKNGQMQMEM